MYTKSFSFFLRIFQFGTQFLPIRRNNEITEWGNYMELFCACRDNVFPLNSLVKQITSIQLESTLELFLLTNGGLSFLTVLELFFIYLGLKFTIWSKQYISTNVFSWRECFCSELLCKAYNFIQWKSALQDFLITNGWLSVF